MESLEGIKYMLCSELDEIAKKGDISLGELETIHKLTDTIKNIHKIEMYEDNARYSYRNNDYSNRNNSYNNSYDSNSNSNYNSNYSYRTPHWVRGHYSRSEDMEQSIREMMNNSNINPSDRDILVKALEVIRK